MAYSAVTDPEIAVGKPLSNALLTKFRDNDLAIPAGLPGAPQVQNAALATDSVRAAQIQANACGQSEIAPDAVQFASQIDTPSDDINIAYVAGAGTLLPAGVYNLGQTTTSCWLEIYCGVTNGWQQHPNAPVVTSNFDLQVVSDGASVRLRGNVAAGSVQARRLAR